MKVLIVSHACVIPMNQKILVELDKYPDIELGFVAPQHFRDELFTDIKFKKHPELHAKSYILKPIFAEFPYQNINLYFYPNCRKIIFDFKPDIIFLDENPWSLSAFQFTCCKGKAKLLFFTSQNIFKRYLPPFSYIEKYVYKNSSGAMVASEETKDVLLKKGFNKEIFIVPYGVDTEQFYSKDVPQLKKKLGQAGYVIGYVGRFSKWKGIEILVRAVKKINDLGIPTSLLLIGRGPEVFKIQRLVNRLRLKKITRILSNVPHYKIPEYLNCMDVLVLPSLTTRSWKEQFGRVIVEALACEVPVIGSDSGEIPNLIKKTGGGVVFPEGNVDALKEKLLLLFQSPETAKKFAKQGKEDVLANYSYKINAKKMYSIYEHTLSLRDEPILPKMTFLVNGELKSDSGVRARKFAQKVSEFVKVSMFYKKGTKFETMLQFVKVILQEKPKLVYLLNPGYPNSSVGLVAKFIGAKLIIDTGDIAHEVSRTLGDRSLLELLFMKNMEKFLWRVSDAILVRGSYFKKWLNEKGYKDVYFIPDGVDLEQMKPVKHDENFRKELGLDECLTIGVLGRSIWSDRTKMCYGWEVVETIKILCREQACLFPTIKGVIIGYGSGIPVLQKWAKEYGIADKIVFINKIPYEEIPKYLDLIDICISTQTNNIVGQIRTTGKLPLYLACNRFIIATKVGEAALVLPKEMLLPYKGIKDSDYPERLSKRLQEIQRQPRILDKKKIGQEIVKNLFEYEKLSDKVASIIKTQMPKIME